MFADTVLVSNTTMRDILDDDEEYAGLYYDLAREWIVALLNEANGAKVPEQVRDTIKSTETALLAWNSTMESGESILAQLDLLSDYNNGRNINLHPGHPKNCEIAPAIRIDADYDTERSKDKLYFNLLVDSVFKRQLDVVSDKGSYKKRISLDLFAGEYIEVVVRFNSDWVGMGGTIRLNAISFSA